MESSSDISTLTCDRPFDDYAFVNLCATKQVDNLSSLLEVERRYCLSADQALWYRDELDRAAGQKASSNSSDWRFRIARWMLRVSNESVVCTCSEIILDYLIDIPLHYTLSTGI